MEQLSHTDLIFFLFAIAAMLIIASIMGIISKKLHCPEIVGELIAGIILGPTIIGAFYSDSFHHLANVTKTLDGFFNIAAIMLLFTAGLEIQIPLIFKYFKITVLTSLMGLMIPLSCGFLVAWCFPELFNHPKSLTFALFLGTALSISALPVITRILIDIDMIKSHMGTIILAAAMLTDMIGWVLFSFLVNLNHHQGTEMVGYLRIIGGLSLLILLSLVMSKYLFPKLLTSSRYLLPLALGTCIFFAVITEFINLHASLGAFIAGIVFNRLLETNQETKKIIEQFVLCFFGPLFFVSIGLKVNLIHDFNWMITLVITALACTTKIAGAFVGARLGGLANRESLSIGFGLNARGLVEIILSTIALNVGLISPAIFVGLVMMALITSMISGPALKWLNSRKSPAILLSQVSGV